MFLRTINKSKSTNNRYKKLLLASALILGIVSDSNVIPKPLFNENLGFHPVDNNLELSPVLPN